MSKIVLEDRIYIKLKRNIKDIKIKLILLARILYVIIIVEDDNSNDIFVEADRDMLTQLISNIYKVML